jgi:gentisate 1,2-dioxygenase
MIVVPSWVPFSIAADDGLDLFQFGDHPIIERLSLNRVQEDDA